MGVGVFECIDWWTGRSVVAGINKRMHERYSTTCLEEGCKVKVNIFLPRGMNLLQLYS